MPLVRVTFDDGFHYSGEPVAPENWFRYGSLRNAHPDEIAEMLRLQIEADKLQALLKTIHDREEAEDPPDWNDPYADHEYCSECRECITCNLRPCRDEGVHKQ